MADDEIIGLDVDFKDAVRNINKLSETLRKSGRDIINFGKSWSTISTNVETGNQAFATGARAIDELGNTIEVLARGFKRIDEETGEVVQGIDNITSKVVKSRTEWDKLKVSIEKSMRESAEIIFKEMDRKNIGQKLAPTKTFRETLIPKNLFTAAPDDTKQQLLDTYAGVIKAQNTAKLTQQELNQVLRAFYENKPTAFIGGQEAVHKALRRTRDLVDEVQNKLNEPGKITKFNDRFAQIIDPRLPKVDFSAAGLKAIGATKKEVTEAKSTLKEFQQFVSRNTDLTRRDISNIFKDLDAGKSLQGVHAEFAEFFRAVEESYLNIGETARKKSGKKTEAQQSAQQRLLASQQRKLEEQASKQRETDLKAERARSLQGLVKGRDELPTVGVPENLLKRHGDAVIAYQ